MAVPSSGQLRLRADINQEINGNDTDTNVSLGTLSNEAGFTEPDTMSEFYGYSACGTPDNFGSQSAGGSPSGSISAQAILYSNGGCNITAAGVYIGTSTNRASATKTQTKTSWGLYSWGYFNLTGYSNNTTYYVWIWATNGVNEGVSNMMTVNVPAPSVPITNNTETPTGDWGSANYCPNYNFIGGLYIRFTNNTSATNVDVYGNNSSSAFQHATNNAAYPGCKYTYGQYPADSSQRQFTAGLRGTCRDYSQCGNTRYIYARYYYSGYSDVNITTSRACNPC